MPIRTAERHCAFQQHHLGLQHLMSHSVALNKINLASSPGFVLLPQPPSCSCCLLLMQGDVVDVSRDGEKAVKCGSEERESYSSIIQYYSSPFHCQARLLVQTPVKSLVHLSRAGLCYLYLSWQKALWSCAFSCRAWKPLVRPGQHTHSLICDLQIFCLKAVHIVKTSGIKTHNKMCNESVFFFYHRSSQQRAGGSDHKEEIAMEAESQEKSPDEGALPSLCLKQVYPKYTKQFNYLRLVERIAALFIRFLGVKGNMRLGPTAFRTFIRYTCGSSHWIHINLPAFAWLR